MWEGTDVQAGAARVNPAGAEKLHYPGFVNTAVTTAIRSTSA